MRLAEQILGILLFVFGLDAVLGLDIVRHSETSVRLHSEMWWLILSWASIPLGSVMCYSATINYGLGRRLSAFGFLGVLGGIITLISEATGDPLADGAILGMMPLCVLVQTAIGKRSIP